MLTKHEHIVPSLARQPPVPPPVRPLRSAAMREVYWVRHAQSTANAGGRSDANKAVVLSPLGVEQAAAFAQAWPFRPGMIVVSPYVRTHQTAMPLRRKFEAVPVEEWPIHEFTFLSRGLGDGTTAAERLELAKPYWQRMDPFEDLGEGSESYASFHTRVASCLSRAASFRGTGPLVVFTHNRVLCQLMTMVVSPPRDVHEGMRRIHGLCSVGRFEVPNCGVLRMTVADGGAVLLGRFDPAASPVPAT